MLVLMYLAGFLPPEHNPLIDDHLIYAVALLLLFHNKADEVWGYGKIWKKSDFVKQYPLFR